MDAEQYAQRIRKIDALIRNKQSDVLRYQEAAEGVSGYSGTEGVQTSKNLQKMSDAVVKYVYIEAEINALKQERQEIIKTIERLPALEYDFVFKHYVKSYTMKELASYFEKSYEWAKWKKRDALKKLQAILDEEKSTV